MGENRGRAEWRIKEAVVPNWKAVQGLQKRFENSSYKAAKMEDKNSHSDWDTLINLRKCLFVALLDMKNPRQLNVTGTDKSIPKG
ncbi:hypothetical protein Tco_0429611 [Tanacetum coccineum]